MIPYRYCKCLLLLSEESELLGLWDGIRAPDPLCSNQANPAAGLSGSVGERKTVCLGKEACVTDILSCGVRCSWIKMAWALR